MSKMLLVIERSVKLNGDAYRKLSEAGYVVVRGDPSKFHRIGSDLSVPDTKLFEYALHAFKKWPGSNAEDWFYRRIAEAVLTARSAPPPTSQAEATTDETAHAACQRERDAKCARMFLSPNC